MLSRKLEHTKKYSLLYIISHSGIYNLLSVFCKKPLIKIQNKIFINDLFGICPIVIETIIINSFIYIPKGRKL